MLKALRLDILVNNAGIGRNAPLHVPDAGLGQLNGAFGAALLGVMRVQKLLADGKPIPPTAAAQPLPEGFAASCTCWSAWARPVCPTRTCRRSATSCSETSWRRASDWWAKGAELIICHGMSMSPIEYPAKDYADAIGVPVLEGLGCAIAMARAWVSTGTPYSRVRHPVLES